MSTFERWAPWWGLVVVPSTFLGLQSAAYAMVPLACRTEQHVLVHLPLGLQVAISVLGVLLGVWLVQRGKAAAGAVPPERRFLNAVSLATAVLFLAAALVQWYVAVALSPCLS